MTSIAVKAKNIQKVFGEGSTEIHVLKGIDLEVDLGELLMIVGPSGCGKTTFLSIIAGTLGADAGEMEVFGTSLFDLSSKEVTRFRGANVGFIFQQFNLISTLNCVENVSIPMIINGHKRLQAEEAARDALTRVGLADRMELRPDTLSGGEQQRVAIARAIVHEPRLVICDEPTSSLDGETGAKIMDILRNIAANPERSVIVVSHDSRIYKHADRIVEMEDGIIKQIHEEHRTLQSREEGHHDAI